MLPLAEALKVGAQIADALAAAHRRGIVHRDLKPGNIMLTPSGARLLDFGLAKGTVITGSVDSNETMAALTAERTILGTPDYMAPEQVEGREADARSDIFALGAVLYEMVSGTRAFQGNSPASVITAIMSSERNRSSKSRRSPLRPSTAYSRDAWRRTLRNDGSRRTISLSSCVRCSSPARAQSPSASRSRTAAWLAAVAAAAGVGLAAGALLFRQDQQVARDQVTLTLLPPAGHEFAGTIANFDIDFAVSPDGKEIAFVTNDPAEIPRLGIRSLSSMTPRLVAGAEGAERPFWSPDSKSIGFKTDAGICRIALPTGTVQVVVPAAHVDGDSKGSWGRGRIIFEGLLTKGGKSVRGIYTVPDSGGAVSVLPMQDQPESEAGQRYPEALPDDGHFIYLSWAADPANRGIYLGSFDSAERTLLVRTGFRASFAAPDTLLYVRDRALVAQRVMIQSRRMVGEPQIVVERLALEGIPGQAAFAASGAGVVAYRTRSQDVESELRWIDRKGSVSQPLGAKASDISVSSSPDERLVAMTRLAPSPTEDRLPGNLWLFDLTRDVPTRLTLDGGRIDENPVWSPDGRRIAYASHRLSALAEVRMQNVSEPGQGVLLFSRDEKRLNPDENFHPIDWLRDCKDILLQGMAPEPAPTTSTCGSSSRGRVRSRA